MPKLIQDRFTSLPVSRQRKYQLRREAAGRCRLCGEPGAPYCARHSEAQGKFRQNRQTTNPQDLI
jgi:hypothetical protein